MQPRIWIYNTSMRKTSLSLSDMKQLPEMYQDLAGELGRNTDAEIRFDGISRMLYSTDASLYQIQPIGVVIPKSPQDVQAVMATANKFKVPVLARGGGSSLAGQAVGQAIVLDFSKYLNRVIQIDPEKRLATTQPGLTIDALNRAAASHGLILGPDPASASRATVGGSLANNASGSHSIRYGMMVDHVQMVKAILWDGSQATFQPVSMEAARSLAAENNWTGRIYRRVLEIVYQNLTEIRDHWPMHWRRASGYNLDRMALPFLTEADRQTLTAGSRFRPPVQHQGSADRINLGQLLVGSEGTLGIITEAALSLVPKPAKAVLGIIPFESVVAACEATPVILETNPSAVELLDKSLMDLARNQPEWRRKMHFISGDPTAVLVVEFDGSSEKEVTDQLGKLQSHLRQAGIAGEITPIVAQNAQADVWAVRKAGLNLLMGTRGDHKPVPGIEDVSVPPDHLAKYVKDILDFCQGKPHIPWVSVYAHASAGCLHIRPMINVKTRAGVELLRSLGEFACDLAASYGGAMSGEHGDGLARSSLNQRLFSPALYQALRDVKQAFDPNNLLNPGKVVDAPPLTENLRFGPGYRTASFSQVFDWSPDYGYAGAIEMCNGSGVCRKLGSGTMCPSYMATLDEKDTTRGRANALRNALAGRIPQEKLYSPEMYDILDLCLGCKACKSECPSSVDMAKIKAEYLVHYYKKHGLPIFNWLMGALPLASRWVHQTRLGKSTIPMINRFLGLSGIKAVLARADINPHHTLPQFAPDSFENLFQKQHGSYQKELQIPEEVENPVILFHDTWTNHFETQIGQAAVQVLEAAGYQIFLPSQRRCCGRPLITGGQADKARAWIDHNVALLVPLAARSIPIIGLEPSCILTVRDEWLSLATDKAQAKMVAEHAFTFEEFVASQDETRGFSPNWRPNPGQVMLHGHCHHKALVGDQVSKATLELAGYQVSVINSGCCGMAGDFGYTQAHEAVSRRIASDRLVPAIYQAGPDTLIVASGTSCRHQIQTCTNRQAMHLVEALALALEEGS